MSMNRVELLLLQRDQSWSREEWIVPLGVALEGVRASVAAWKPQGGGNSIWETVRHINFYNDRLLRLTGEPLGEGAASNDATFLGEGGSEDEAAWQATLGRTHELADRLRETIAALSEGDLEKPYIESTVGRQLADWMLHDGYHSGQVVLIRKQLGDWR
ncbi:DinB family protein [Paenibacillus sp. LHD-117]|uniref:DinB family protein n=1 Tax=Paenibacillus sp. LHD-117 TaxID=3071412 RepID=UPI0027E1B76D|nr:DinB family protein [Paenibacillus sp. LHD-117]MDQ6421513.1 DinB family protein [Paenibacillus sp. LHD-117]